MDVVWATLLLILAVVFWALNVVGLPGNWFVFAAATLYAFLLPSASRHDISWGSVLALLGLAVLGEVVEFVAGAWGTTKAGGSRRAAVLALAGSLAGGLFGLAVGVPLPLIGSVVGALLFGGLGALAGAVAGERWKGRTLDQSLRVGEAAFWGRLLGTLGKTLAGALMIGVLLASAYF